jgi:hypothetical protein
MKRSSKLTKHHRLPKSVGGTNHPDNISIVTQSKHRAYHVLFDNRPPEEIADILNAIWIDKRKKLISVPTERYSDVLMFLYRMQK